MERRPLPVACSLDREVVPDRLDAWRALHADLRWSRVDGGRLEAAFADGVAPELARLAAAERSCCGWATWSVDEATLVVTGPAAVIASLAEALLGLSA